MNLSPKVNDALVIALRDALEEADLLQYEDTDCGDIDWARVPSDTFDAGILMLKLYESRP